MKIIFTGGSGRFGKKFRDKTRLKNIFYPSSKEMNITDYNSIKKYLSKHKPKIVIHCAALSRPMDIHDRQINKSIDINKLLDYFVLKKSKYRYILSFVMK